MTLRQSVEWRVVYSMTEQNKNSGTGGKHIMKKKRALALGLITILLITGCGAKKETVKQYNRSEAGAEAEETKAEQEDEVTEEQKEGQTESETLEKQDKAAPKKNNKPDKLASSPEEWDISMLDPDMYDLCVKYKQLISEKGRIENLQKTDNILWITEHKTPEQTFSDEVTIEDITVISFICGLAGMQRSNTESTNEPIIKFETDTDIAKLLGFDNEDAMSELLESSANAEDDNDVTKPDNMISVLSSDEWAPEYSWVFDRYYFTVEGDAELLKFSDDTDIRAQIARDKQSAIVDFENAYTTYVENDNKRYAITLANTVGTHSSNRAGLSFGYTTSDSQMSSVTANWKGLIEESEKIGKGYITNKESKQCIVDGVTFIITSEDFIVSASKDELSSVYSPIINCVTDWEKLAPSITNPGEDHQEELDAVNKQLDILFVEYLGIEGMGNM